MACNCSCQYRTSEVQINQRNFLYTPLAKKPSVENGETTDQYDEGEFELVEYSSPSAN